MSNALDGFVYDPGEEEYDPYGLLDVHVNQSRIASEDVNTANRVEAYKVKDDMLQTKGEVVPVDVIESDLNTYQKQQNHVEISPYEFPTTAKALTDQELASLFFDDQNNMQETEGFFKNIGDKWRLGKNQMAMADIGRRMRTDKGTIEDERNLANLEKDNQQLEAQEFSKNWFAQIPGTVVEMIPLQLAALTSKTTAATTVAGGAAGTVVPGVGTVAGLGAGVVSGTIAEVGMIEADLAYLELQKLRDANGKKLPENVIRGTAAVVGLINGAIELGGDKILGGIGAKTVKTLVKKKTKDLISTQGFVKTSGRVGSTVGAGMLLNGGEEALQETTNILATEVLGEIYGAETDNAGQNIERVLESFSKGAQGGVGVSMVEAVPFAYMQLKTDAALNKNKNIAEYLGGLTTDSKVLADLPPRYQQFVKDTLAEHGAATHVSMPVDTLDTFFQSEGLSEDAISKNYPEVAASMQQARQTGAEVQVPTEVFSATFMKSENFTPFLEDVRMHPEMNTDRENKQMVENFKNISMPNVETLDTDTYTHFKEILDQVDAPEEADFKAKLLASFYTTNAKKAGITPQQMVERFPVDIGRGIVTPKGQVVSEVPIGEEKTQKYDIGDQATQQYQAQETKPLTYEDIDLQSQRQAKKEAVSVVEEMPVYKNAAEIKKRGGLRLDSFKQDYDTATTGALQKKYPGLFSKKSEVQADELATDLGYENLDQLVQDLLSAEGKGREIEKLTKQNMDNWLDAEQQRLDAEPTLNEAGELVVDGEALFQTEELGFDNWAEGNEVISGTDINEAEGGKGYVFETAHGTTHDFTEFDPTVTGNKEGAFGAVNYFTSDPGDAAQNYAGEGPDLTNRIEQRKEQVEQDLEEYDFEGDYQEEIARVQEDYNIELDANETWDADSIAEFLAREELSGGGSKVLNTYVKLNNPAFVNGDTDTWIENQDTEQYREDAVAEVLEENDAENTEENIEEYEDQIQERIDEMAIDDEPAIYVALENAINQFETDADVQAIYGELELDDPDITAADLEQRLRDSESLSYVTDYESGELISSHIIGQVFKELGFDGVVLQNADQRFPGMDMGTGTSHVHVFEETPSNIKSVDENVGTYDPNDPNIYHQEKRGAIQRSASKDYFKITLTGKADQSTVLHESGHMFLDIMSVMAETVPEIAEDYAIVREYVGAEGDKPFTREQHEMFAEGFEQYLMTNEAPSIELRSAFQRFNAWLVHIYKNIGAFKNSLTPEVKEVMDRMLVSKEAIKLNAEMKTLFPVISDPNQIGMSDEEYTAYLVQHVRTLAGAEEEMRTKLMKEITVRKSKEYRAEKKRLTEEITADAKARPIYQAIEFLKSGVLEGVEDPPDYMGKFDREQIRALYPNMSNIISLLPRNITVKDGADIDLVSRYFGYISADALVQQMLDTKPMKQSIKEEVDQSLKAIYGDSIAQLETVQKEANDALHGDAVGDFLTKELRMLSKASNRPLPPNFTRQAQVYADQVVSGMTVSQLRSSHSFLMASQREGNKAVEAATRNDWAAAAEAKKNQVINHWLYRKANAAKVESDKIHRYLKKFETLPKQQKLGKAGDFYRDSINHMLVGVELKKQTLRSLQRRESLNDYITKMEEQGQIVQIDDSIRDELSLRNFQQMKLEEFRALRDAVKNIDRLSMLKNKLIDGKKKRDFKETVRGLSQTVRKNNKFIKSSKTQNGTAWENAKAKMKGFDTDLLKVEFIIEQMDGGEVGFVHEQLFQPMADAQLAYYDKMEKLEKSLIAPLKDVPKEQKARLGATYNFHGTTMKGHEVLSVALNMGNAGNLQRLIDGYSERGYTEESLMEELDRILTKEDWALVQHIWDQVNQFWPDIEELNKRNTGLAPPKVEAREVVTAHGTFRGGYYPVIYDTRKDSKQSEYSNKNSDVFENNFMRPTVSKGFTEARAKKMNKPLMLSLNVLGGHLNEVVHYVTHYEAINNVNRLINSAEFTQAVYDTMGQEYHQAFTPWLQNIANSSKVGNETTFVDKFANHLAIGTSIVAMAGSLSTGMMQFLGFTSALSRINAKNLGIGMKAMLTKEGRKFAYDNSREIPHALKTFDRDARKHMDTLVLQVAGKGTVKKVHGDIVKYSFMLIGHMQQQVNIATFLGAYTQGVNDLGYSESKAVTHADSIMRKTQSGGAAKDLAAIQRGGALTRMVTAFYTYFSALYGLLRSTGTKVSKGKYLEAGMDIAALILLPTFIEQVMRPDPEDEDMSEWWTRYAKSTLGYGVATLPMIRDVVGFLSDDYGYRFAPAADMLERGFGSGKALIQVAFTDKELQDMTPAQWKNLARGVGQFAHLPVVPATRGYDYYNAYIDGELDEPIKEFIFGVKK